MPIIVRTIGQTEGDDREPLIARAPGGEGALVDWRVGRRDGTRGFGPVTVWQLPAGEYIPAKMPPQFVNCFPDSESFADERHRRVPSGVASTHPIAIQGGARPLNYTLVDAPVGMSISETGVIAWSDQVAEGSHTVTVRVRTQDWQRQPDGRSDEVWGEITQTWTMEFADKEDTTKFIWLAQDGNDTDAGSFTAPKASFDEVLTGTDYAGRQIHLKAGTYNTDGPGQFRLGDSRPRVIAGAGKDVSYISYTERNFAIAGDGCYCSGFTTLDGGYSTSNIRLFVMDTGVSRKGWFNIKFQGTRMGTSGSDNPACIFSSGHTTPRNYTSIHSCEDIGRDESSTNSALLCTIYSDNDIAIEYCVGDGLAAGGVNLKDSNQRCTVAFCDIKNSNVGAGSVIVGCQTPSRAVTRDIEICYNYLDAELRLNYQSVSETGSMYVYRNSLKGRVRVLNSSGENTGPYYIHNNAVQTTNTPIISTGSSMQVSDNIEASSGVFDEEFKLTSTYSEFVGQRGAEF